MGTKSSHYARKKMTKFEYKTVEELLPISIKTLDEMSKGGWELVAIITFIVLKDQKYISYFKRESFK